MLKTLHSIIDNATKIHASPFLLIQSTRLVMAGGRASSWWELGASCTVARGGCCGRPGPANGGRQTSSSGVQRLSLASHQPIPRANVG